MTIAGGQHTNIHAQLQPSPDIGINQTNSRIWPVVRIQHDARKRPHAKLGAAASCWLDFSLLGNLQRVIYLNAKVPDRGFQLGMAQ